VKYVIDVPVIALAQPAHHYSIALRAPATAALIPLWNELEGLRSRCCISSRHITASCRWRQAALVVVVVYMVTVISHKP